MAEACVQRLPLDGQEVDRTQRIRVLRIIGGLDPEFGGPSESSVNACLAVQARHVANTFVFPVAAGSVDGIQPAQLRLSESGVDVKGFPVAGWMSSRSREWGISPRLIVWLARHSREYDVIHLHGAWGASQIAALLIARLGARPTVLTPHESLTGFDLDGSRSRLLTGCKRALRRLYLANLSLIVFSSAKEEQDSLPAGTTTASTVIPHPMAELLQRPPRMLSHQHAGLPLCVGFLGRLHPKKNLDVLIRAVARSSSTATLVVGGDGPPEFRRALEALAADLSMTERMEWRGFVARADRADFFDAIDVLAMPSAYECFGMVAAEALACGIPTIVSSNTGIAEIIIRHRAGVVAAPTVEGFAEAIRQLVDDPGLLVELAKRGRAAAEAELSVGAHGVAQLAGYQAIRAART